MASDIRPQFTDVGAYARSVPGSARVADAAPVYEAVGETAGAAMKLAGVFYQQDQDKAVLDAKIGMAQGFAELRQKVSEETDFTKAQQMFDDGATAIKAKAAPFEIDGNAQAKIGASYAASYQSAQADVYQRITALRSAKYLESANALGAQLRDTAPLDGQLDRTLSASKAQVREQGANMFKTGTLDEANAGKWTRGHLGELDDALATWDVKNNPQMALKALKANKDGKWQEYTDLDVKRREVLISAADGAMRANAANVDELQVQAVDNILTGQGNGRAQIQEAYRRGMQGSRAQDFEGMVKASEVTKSYLDRARYKPISEWGTVKAEFEKAASESGNEYLKRMKTTLHSQLDALEKQWKADPAATADREFPLPKHPEGKPWPLTAVMNQRRGVIDAMGLGFEPDKKGVYARDRLLTEPEVGKLSAALVNAPPSEKATAMTQLQKDLGPWVGLGVQQLRREADLPYAYVLMGDPSVSPTGVNILASTAGRPAADLAKGLADPDTQRKLIENATRQQFRDGPWRTFQNPDDATAAMEATVAAALRYGQEDAGSAADRAIKDIWGKLDIVGTARMPVGTTAEQKAKITYGLADATRNLERFKPALATGNAGADTLLRLKSEGRWYTYTGAGGKDEGVELKWGLITVADTEGRPIRIPFDDLTSLTIPDTNAQQAAALANPQTRLRLSAQGSLPPTPGAYR